MIYELMKQQTILRNAFFLPVRRTLSALPFADKVRAFAEDENGVGVIEVVLILVVLIGLVAVFKTQINDLLTKIFGSISSMSDDIL